MATNNNLVEYASSHSKYCEEESLENRQKILKDFEDILKECVINHGKSIKIDEGTLLNGGIRLLPFGGQQIGLVTEDSDIDVVLIAPKFITRNAFFQQIPPILKEYPGFTYMRVVEAAHVPVIKLIFKSIQFDVCFARFQMDSIPVELDLVPTDILKGMDPECIRSINGVRETCVLIEAVPDLEVFLQAVKVVKYWAKTKPIYGAAMGFLGGISWNILVAFCYQKNPGLPVEKLLQMFFHTMANWQWPQAVMLRPLEKDTLKMKQWNPQMNTGDQHHKMPIITPVYPEHNCAFTVMKSTQVIIMEYLQEACGVIDSILEGGESCDALFMPAPFFIRYKHFLVVISKAKTEQDHNDWGGLIEAKLRHLVTSLEKQQFIDLAHPYPKSFDHVDCRPDLFRNVWFIGLQFSRTTGIKLDLAQDIQDFNDTLSDAAHLRQFYNKGMKIEVKHVKRKRVNDYIAQEFTIY